MSVSYSRKGKTSEWYENEFIFLHNNKVNFLVEITQKVVR